MFRLIILSIIINSSLSKYISLNSDDWTLNDGKNKYFLNHVTVPGGVYSSLYKSGLIEDPLRDKNDIVYRNFSKLDWIWSKNFHIHERDLTTSTEAYLIIDGIDTISTIYLNGHFVGETVNMFVRYTLNVTGLLTLGSNSLRIQIKSPINYALQSYNDYTDRFNYTIVPTCPDNKYNGECHANFIRKMACAFAWDWGPAFPSSSIWLPIGLELIDRPLLDDIIASVSGSPESQWNINITLRLLRPVPSFYALVTVTLDGKRILREQLEVSGQFIDLPDITLPANSVELWWPNGMGQMKLGQFTQYQRTLYNLTVSLRSINEAGDYDEEIIGTKTKRIGFRSIELIQQPIIPNEQSKGLTFKFLVNGRSIFIKGTNVIPFTIFPETGLTEDIEYVQYLFKVLENSSINMIRIWGGGIYQFDYVYDLADKHGIMIWQDFMFACMTYPSNDDFLFNVAREIEHQVDRLKHHPSIVVWGGNNENEVAIASPWWTEITYNFSIYKADYLRLNQDTIQRTVNSRDPHRIFIPSSPTNGAETELEGGLSQHPGSYLFGDVHFYQYDRDAWNQEKYPRARFISEYGFESHPSLSTYQKVIERSKLTYPLSDSLESRQHHPQGSTEINDMITYYLKLPYCSDSYEALRQYIYLSQVIQSEAIKTETEVYLRNREIDPVSNLGGTWGAIYWMLNDVWAAPTWSSIEFGGKWKMLHYIIREIFKQVHCSAYLANGIINVTVNNDVDSSVSVYVDVFVQRFNSFEQINLFNKTVNLERSEAKTIWTDNLSEIIQNGGCLQPADCIIGLKFHLINNLTSSQSNIEGENYLFLDKPNKATNLINSVIKVTTVNPIETSDSVQYEIELVSDNPALFVWLDFTEDSNIEGIFSSNGFMMLQSEKKVLFQSKNHIHSTDIIRNSLVINHLAKAM